MSWDEETFILVAQRLSLGELPFTTTFENKPPLFSVLLALPQFFAPDSRFAVRLTLAAVVILTAIVVWATLTGATGSSFAGTMAGLTVAGVSALAPAGEAWMSQHSANLWLAVLLLLLFGRQGWSPADSGIAGIVAAVLILTRTNYVVPAAAILLLGLLRRPVGDRLAAVAWMVVGGVITAGAVLATYALAGELPALLAGVYEVLVADGGQGDLQAVVRLPPRWFVSASAILVVFGAAAFRRAELAGDEARGLWWAGIVMALFMGVSVLLHQSIFPHYLLMFGVPLAILGGLSAHAISQDLLNLRRPGLAHRRGWSSAAIRLGLPMIAAAVLARPAGFDPEQLVPDVGGTEQALQDDIASTLEEFLADRPGPVWALTDHYVYWRTGTLPPHPLVTHPSSLVKPEFWASVPMDDMIRPTTFREAIDLILATGPRYVVATEQLDEWYLDRLPAEDRAHLAGHLNRDYRIAWRSADDIVIRERRPSN